MAAKWRQNAKRVEWAFLHGQPTPSLRTFAPGRSVHTASAIMQFRRNIYEYSTKKSAHHFRMQSKREQTLVKLRPHMHSKVYIQEAGEGTSPILSFLHPFVMIWNKKLSAESDIWYNISCKRGTE